MSRLREITISLFMFFFSVFVQIYTFITLPIYYLIQKPHRKLKLASIQRSLQIDPKDPYSPWVRVGEAPYHILMTCETISEGFQMARSLYPSDRPAIGYRKIIQEEVVADDNGKEVRVDGKVLRKFRLSDYQWMTYGEIFDKSDLITKGLLINGFKRKEKIVLLSETCADVLIFGISLANVGAVTVSVFATLGDDGITFAINETKSNYILTTYDLLPKVCNLLARCPKLSTIIYFDSQIQSKNNNNNALNFPKNVKLWSMSKLIADGMKAAEDLQGFPLNSEDTLIIGYTSGTTGPPKGVFATIKQVREAGITTLPVIEKFMKDPERQIYVAYLPQAHILEASIELIAFLGGCRIGFATPFTLNESAPGLADREICDLKLLKPTIMTTVPLVLDRMRKEMYFKLDNRTPVSTHLFDYLIDYKIKWTQRGYECPIVNMLLCPKVREQFGGKLEFMIVGGAPLSPQLQALIKASLNVTLAQGFGATETLGAVICMDDNDLSYGRCGAPLNGVRLKLIDWIEGEYKVIDKPNPRGELVVGGYNIASGYYNNPKLTEESFSEDDNGRRWFFTGDIAEVFPDGTFKIIDRKKDLIKLANGEYFSLGKIESALKNCSYVENICIIGDAFVNYLVALVMPNIKALNFLSKKLGLPDMPLEHLCANDQVIQTIHEAIKKSGFQHNLKRNEIPLKIAICPEEWTPDNGILTAAMKLKRSVIANKFKSEIERMFSQNNSTKS